MKNLPTVHFGTVYSTRSCEWVTCVWSEDYTHFMTGVDICIGQFLFQEGFWHTLPDNYQSVLEDAL